MVMLTVSILELFGKFFPKNYFDILMLPDIN